MKTYAYIRVSTEEQSYERQLIAIQAHIQVDTVFAEKVSARKKRPQLEKLLSLVNSSDTVVVYQISRLGRSLKQLLHIMEQLQTKEVTFISVVDHISTESPHSKFFFHLLCILSELETDILSHRSKSGIEAARRAGKQIGRPKGATKEILNKVNACQQMIDFGQSTVVAACAVVGISKPTYYRWRK